MVVYLTTNLVNDKKYIGKDVKNNPNYLGSGALLLEDIKKYGKQNFKKEILEFCQNNDILEERENYWINYHNALHDNNFYNIRENVKNWYSKASDDKKQYIKNKISQANKGKKHSNETKQKISQANKGKIKGHYHTFKSKSKISESNKGRKHTKEERIKMSENKKGWKPTEEQRTKMSENRKGHPMYTDAWRQKISQSLKNTKKSKEFKEKISESLKGNTNRRKKVIQYNMNGEFIKEWECVLEAARFLGKTQGAGITEVCNGSRKSIYGYIWKYKI